MDMKLEINELKYPGEHWSHNEVKWLHYSSVTFVDLEVTPKGHDRSVNDGDVIFYKAKVRKMLQSVHKHASYAEKRGAFHPSCTSED